MRRAQGHVVVCGLDEAAMAAVRNLTRDGRRVVVVAAEPWARSAGPNQDEVARFVGDPSDPAVLRRAGVPRAAHVLAMSGDDAVNTSIALAVQDAVRGTPGRPLVCLVEVTDPDIATLLRIRALELSGEERFRLDFLDLPDAAARALLREHPPRSTTDPAWIVVACADVFGRRVATLVADGALAADPEDARRPRLTVLGRDVEAVQTGLAGHAPAVAQSAQVEFRPVDDWSSPLSDAVLAVGGRGPDAVYVLLPDEVEAFSAAYAFRRAIPDPDVPVVMRTARVPGLQTLLGSDSGPSMPTTFAPFDHACEPSTLLGGVYESVARALHDRYRVHAAASGETVTDNPSAAPWSELDERLRDANRAAAMDIGSKLAAIGCGLVPAGGPSVFAFTSDEVERLAPAEHDRWAMALRSSGWSYAPGPRDPRRRTNPSLLPWGELPEEVREANREQIRELPALLERAGCRIIRIPRRDTTGRSDR
jgi:hypothetical protein